MDRIRPGILYHFIKFGSHASRGPPKRRNVTEVTLIFLKCRTCLGSHPKNRKNFAACGTTPPKISCMSRQLWESAETKISARPSRVTGPAELNEILQYTIVRTQYE